MEAEERERGGGGRLEGEERGREGGKGRRAGGSKRGEGKTNEGGILSKR